MTNFQTIGGSFSLDRTGLFTGSEKYVFPINPGSPDFSNAESFASSYEDSNFFVDESGCFIVGEYRSTDARGMITEELDFSMKEEPIQSHPNWNGSSGIAAKYGYDSSTQQFPRVMPSTTSQSNIQNPSSTSASMSNPLYGVTSYLSMTAIFRKNQTVTDLVSINGLFDNIGKISGPVYDLISIPVLPSRNWLKLAPKINSRAGVFEVSEQWQLSGAGGWNSKIYKPAI